MLDYLTLFASAFFAATILPFYSEIVLLTLIAKGHQVPSLIATATLGNTLGAVVNWLLGIYILKFKDKRWFYFTDKQIFSAQTWFRRYGIWTLLFAWLPVVGDALTLIAGTMRVRLPVFLILVAIGKGIRYLLLSYTLGLML